MVRPNPLKEKLKSGGIAVGCFVQYPSAATVEILGYSGFDFVLVDCEHGPTSEESAYHMALAAEATNTVPLLRVPQNSPQTLLRFLDSGIAGVMVPQVNTRAEAEAAVAAIKYHPSGRRGIAGVRAAAFGITHSLTEYASSANQETMAILQIENIAAVDQVPEILKVADVDVLFVGPNDLAHSMGYPGQITHPDVQAAIDRVIEMVKGTDVTLGTVAPNAEAANRLIDRGFRMIGGNSATLLAAASKDMLSGINR